MLTCPTHLQRIPGACFVHPDLYCPHCTHFQRGQRAAYPQFTHSLTTCVLIVTGLLFVYPLTHSCSVAMMDLEDVCTHSLT
jgi:hypothetical protein